MGDHEKCLVVLTRFRFFETASAAADAGKDCSPRRDF
jgi:hypothetical protein